MVSSLPRVLRNGKVPHPTITSRPAAFNGIVRYRDGLRLDVTGVRQSKVTAQGPGEFPGEPKTQVGLRMSNHGSAGVNLNRVVVTAVYGPDHRRARPVYDEHSRDFGGELRAGRSTTATYSFSVPRRDLDHVTMVVDFDGRHTAATFRGDPRSAR